MHHPTERIAHTTDFDISVVDNWLEREIALWVHHTGEILYIHRLNVAQWYICDLWFYMV